MVQSSSSDQTPVSACDRVIDATLALTAERGWSQFGLSDLAQAADVSLAELRALLAESAAFRAFSRRAPVNILVNATSFEQELGTTSLEKRSN